MELDIPEAFLQVATCFSTDLLGDGKTLTGLCTSSGQLLEFINGEIIDSFDLDREADDVMIFTSYNPVQKYYLIRCKQQLVVIKRQKPLSIIKTYENVTGVKIEDRLQLGRPQTVIWTQDDQEPTVTDFVGQLYASAPQPVPQLTTSLSGKLHEMSLRLAKARKLLHEKRNARVKALYQLTPHLQPHDSQAQEEEPYILAWGPPFLTLGKVTQPPLELSQPWRRVHNDKWIVGVPVFNTSNTPVEDVKLRLQMDGAGQELSYDTYLVVFPQRRSEGAQWTEPAEQEDLICLQRCIPSRMSAVIVAVVEEPLLKISAAVTVSGSVLYTIHESPQGKSCYRRILDLLPADIQFRVEELVEGSLRPFSSCQESVEGVTEADLVSAVVTSGMWKLRVSSRHNLSAPLQPSDCGLQRVPPLPPHCWVGRNSGSLAGMVVIHRQVSGLEHQLELYARDVKQALQLVHTLRSSWRVEECRDCGVSVSDCVRSLAAELRVLHNVFQPAAQISPERWAEIRKQLTSLELTADLAFSEYSSRN